MDRYLAQGQLNGTVDRTVKVKVDNSAEIANLQQQAGIGNAILAGAKMYVDQMQTADIMKASNMYNDKMSELRNKLLQNKEESAMENMNKYEEGRKKILDEIYKTGPLFVREGLGRQKFENSIEKDWIGQKDQMRGYIMQEGNKYQDNQLANRLYGYNQNIADGWSNGLVLAANVEAGEEEIRKRYQYYGEEKIQSVINQWRGQAYNNAITMALGAGKYDQAGAMLQGYGKWLDPKTRASLDKMITAQKRSDNMMGSIDNLFARYGKNAEAAWAEYSKTLVGGNTNVAQEANKMIGQQLGNNTCAIFVGNMVTAAGGDTSLISTLADGTYLNYENRGLTYTDRSQLRDGDVVFWQVDGAKYTASDDKNAVTSNDKAYKGITHVGIYDAKTGKVIQSGSSGVSAMDIDTSGYHFVAAAHQPSKTLNPTEMEKQRQQFFAHYDNRVSRLQKQENLTVENAANQLLALSQSGKNLDSKAYEKIIYGITGNNWDMYSKLMPLATHFGKGNFHTLSFLERYNLEEAIDTGTLSQEELKNKLIQMNVKPETAMEYIKKNKTALAKEGKVDWTRMEQAFYEKIGGKDKVTKEQMMGVIMAAKRHVAEYNQDPKTKGQTPSVDHIINYMENSLMTGAAGEAAGGYKDYSVSDLMRHSIYRIDDAGNGNCLVYFFGNDKPVRISEENLAKGMSHDGK